MASTYTTNLRLTKQGDGENPNSWGQILNDGVISLADEAIAGYTTISIGSAATVNLTANDGSDDQSRSAFLEVKGSIGTVATSIFLVIPNKSKSYSILNKVSANATSNVVMMRVAGHTGVTLTRSSTLFQHVVCDGTSVRNVTQGEPTFSTLEVTGAATFDSTVTVSGASSYVGAATFYNTVTVVGNAVFAGDIQKKTAGTSNFAAGVNAGNSIESGGNYNVVIGDEAGTAITTGDNNVAVGFNCLDANTTGSDNTAVGYSALGANITGANNVAVGVNTLSTNTSGSSNTALGRDALFSNTTANSNVAVGYQALDDNTTGASNTAVGTASLGANTTGARNVAIGSQALSTNTTGASNTGVGMGVLNQNTTGSTNVAIGDLCLDANTTASNNTGVGYASLSDNTTGASNTAVGRAALFDNTTGSNNSAFGYATLAALTTGSNNTAVGLEALLVNTTGVNNVAVGKGAGLAMTTAVSNTCIGSEAGAGLTTGGENVFVGNRAGVGFTTGSQNNIMGDNACANGTITGGNNVVIGDNSAYAATGAFASNTLIGGNNSNAITTGTNNLFLGKGAGNSGSPGGSITTESHHIILGDENITNAHIQVDWTVASDKRDKTEVTPLVMGLDFINKLEPVTYRWDKRSKYSKDQDVTPDGTHKEEQLDVGFLAQDVEELEKEYGFNFEDKTNLMTNISEGEKMYGLKYSKFVPALVKAVQELTAKVTELEDKLNG
jgi:hypothetical protein